MDIPGRAGGGKPIDSIDLSEWFLFRRQRIVGAYPESNGTRVSHTIFVQPRGLFKRLVWAAKVRHKHDKIVELLLDNLKQTAEFSTMWAEQMGDGDTDTGQP